MRYWVGCTITAQNSGLACEIEIGHFKSNDGKIGAQQWKLVGGRLDVRDDAGNWMYGPAGLIALVSTSDAGNPYWHNPANWLVQFDNVPERFAEKLGCGEYFRGEGTLFLTNEPIRWKMFFPCA